MSSQDPYNFSLIESDPGVFTEMIQHLGIKGVQMEEIADLDSISDFKPVYGLVFLFKWQADEKDARPTVDNPSDVFFAAQVVQNACATQAIINCLFNRHDVDLGVHMSQFKQFVKGLSPKMRGESIGEDQHIRTVHNSFARPEPFYFEEKHEKDEETEDAFHFVAYVPVGSKLYELDGLKKGPIVLGDCTTENWLEKVAPIIKDRIARYSTKEIRFNLMAVIENRQEKYAKELKELEEKKKQFVDDKTKSEEEKKTASLKLTSEMNVLQEKIALEKEKFAKWKAENVRRRHNYVPFIFALCQQLASKGKLSELFEQGKKVVAERRAKAAEQKKKEHEKEAQAKKTTSATPSTTASKTTKP
eukprot:TRINITY_DN373_c2_g1_i1.p1 TRINITY_DN373_c2_g1~~TRINITY_DN373_c2_g1_i1.p1  ORF type:complete len:360 (-),score=100.72 TRINITY_DN373_c2_g1_i1:236-1315(-)